MEFGCTKLQNIPQPFEDKLREDKPGLEQKEYIDIFI